jgi:hypothetical protein
MNCTLNSLRSDHWLTLVQRLIDRAI